MKCKEFRSAIDALFEGGMDVARLEEHMAGCPACAEYYRQTKGVLGMVTPRVMPDAPASLKGNVMDKAAGSGGALCAAGRYSLKCTVSQRERRQRFFWLP